MNNCLTICMLKGIENDRITKWEQQMIQHNEHIVIFSEISNHSLVELPSLFLQFYA